jgi:hypothetical protein
VVVHCTPGNHPEAHSLESISVQESVPHHRALQPGHALADCVVSDTKRCHPRTDRRLAQTVDHWACISLLVAYVITIVVLLVV